VRFRKTAFGEAPGLPDRKSTRFKQSVFEIPTAPAANRSSVYQTDDAVVKFLDDEEYDILNGNSENVSEISDLSDFESISQSLLRNQQNSLYKETVGNIFRSCFVSMFRDYVLIIMFFKIIYDVKQHLAP